MLFLHLSVKSHYFIYSSQESHELCYATSEFPDRGFTYRGILNSNGDVGLNGRKPEDRLNMTANNHGSLECVGGQWYVFYHRQTHNSTYSRQACAEKVTIQPDGSIAQAECTSCGLNGGPLTAKGTYPAPIACNLTNGRMPHATNRIVNADIPYITHQGRGKEAERFITNIMDGTRIGFSISPSPEKQSSPSPSGVAAEALTYIQVRKSKGKFISQPGTPGTQKAWALQQREPMLCICDTGAQSGVIC